MTNEDRIQDLLDHWEELAERGQDLSAEELCQDYPELVEMLRILIAALKQMRWLDKQLREGGEEREASGNGEGMSGRIGMVPFRAGDEPIPGYRLVERLGKGAFGEVWSANNLGRRYAVKFISGGPDLSEEECRVNREKAGLDCIKSVNHPFILHRHTHKINGTLLILLTELADTSLKQCFENRRRTRTPRLYAHVLYLLRDAAEALDYLQEKGLMHLDVKPANLLLVKGRCKIGDFGTVRAIRPGERVQGRVALSVTSTDNPEQITTVYYLSIQDVRWKRLESGSTLFTNTGNFTSKYAPPEAFDGKFSRTFDQYSLALTFCELVTGTIPFREREPDLGEEKKAGKMELGCYPEQLRPVLAQALSPSPDERFDSCMGFVNSMRTALWPLLRRDRKARAAWLEGWPEAEEATAGGDKRPFPSLPSPGRRGKRTIQMQPSVGTAARVVPLVLALVFSPFRTFGNWTAGLRASVDWCLRTLGMLAAPAVKFVLWLVILAAPCLVGLVLLIICLNRIQALKTLPCYQEDNREENQPIPPPVPQGGMADEKRK
jgi:serine/threonine protein kinase